MYFCSENNKKIIKNILRGYPPQHILKLKKIFRHILNSKKKQKCIKIYKQKYNNFHQNKIYIIYF